jgi:hypothetical protein
VAHLPIVPVRADGRFGREEQTMAVDFGDRLTQSAIEAADASRAMGSRRG